MCERYDLICTCIYKYRCTLPEDDPKMVETCRSCTALTVKTLYYKAVHLLAFYRILSVSEWMWIPQNSALRPLMKANRNNQMKCAYELWITLNMGILCYAHFIQYMIHCLRCILLNTPPHPLINYRETDRQTAGLATCTPRWLNHWPTQQGYLTWRVAKCNKVKWTKQSEVGWGEV